MTRTRYRHVCCTPVRALVLTFSSALLLFFFSSFEDPNVHRPVATTSPSVPAKMPSVVQPTCFEALVNGRASTKLNLSNCGLTAEVLSSMFRSLGAPYSGVTTLDLGSNNFETLPVELFSFFPNLDTLFLTQNRLNSVPPNLQHTKITRLSLKSNNLSSLDAFLLPSTLIHLILTENNLSNVKNLGRLRSLRKLMLSGNRLRSISSVLMPSCPEDHSFETEESGDVEEDGAPPNDELWRSLQEGAKQSTDRTLLYRDSDQDKFYRHRVWKNCSWMQKLELIRLARNRIDAFSHLDEQLLDLHRSLAWISLAGNAGAQRKAKAFLFLNDSLQCSGDVVGRGASGVVERCRYTQEGSVSVVALKRFKKISSDGSRQDEISVLSRLPHHPHVLGPLGALANGNEISAIAFPFVTGRPLALPPDITSVTKARFYPLLRVPHNEQIRIARDVISAVQALHDSGVLHGDLYAHNVMYGSTNGEGGQIAFLTDFGASFFIPLQLKRSLLRIEARALARFIDDLVTVFGGDRNPPLFRLIDGLRSKRN